MTGAEQKFGMSGGRFTAWGPALGPYPGEARPDGVPVAPRQRRTPGAQAQGRGLSVASARISTPAQAGAPAARGVARFLPVGPGAGGAVALSARLFAGVVAVALAGPVAAQGTTCLPRAAFVQLLAERYGAGALWGGLSQTGLLTEGFVNAATGSWTLTVTTPQGLTCLLAAGQAFEVRALPAAVPGVPG